MKTMTKDGIYLPKGEVARERHQPLYVRTPDDYMGY